MHIIGTSVAFWFRTIMEEAFEDFVHKMDYFKAKKPELSLLLMRDGLSGSGMANVNGNNNGNLQLNATSTILTLMSSPISDTITPNLIRHLPDSYACAQNTLLTTKSMNALPYLYPFTIEYNLLLASTFLSLYFNIGKVGHKGNGAGSCNYTPDCSASTSIGIGGSDSTVSHYNNSNNIHNHHHHHHKHSDNSSSVTKAIDHVNDKEMGEYKSNFVVNADCHSANKGLFCGFFVLLVTLVTIVIFFVTINKPSHVQLGIKINLIQEATLTVLILLVTLAGLKQMNKLNRNRYLKEKVTTDDVLMLIPLPFFFIHSLLSFRAETASLISSSISIQTSSIASTLHNDRPTRIAIELANRRVLQDADDNAMDAASSRLNLIGLYNGTLSLYQDNFIKDSMGQDNNIDNGSGINIINNNDNNKTIDKIRSNTIADSRRNNVLNIENFATTTIAGDSGRSRSSDSSNINFDINNKRPIDSGSISSSSISGSIVNSNNNFVSENISDNISTRRRVTRSNRDGLVRTGKFDNNIASSNNNNNDSSSNGNSISSSFNFSQIDHFKLITVLLNIIVMIEVLVQTNFIIDGMRRCSESRYMRFKKPGRELITFAILLNITYWIVATFETKSVEQYKTEIEYYGPLPYMFISHTTLPVMLFYRYHSSVCLTEIWNRAYKLPKEH